MPTLPDLPTELLMEIVKSYDPDVLSPVDARIHGVPRTDAEQLGGNEVLRVLSQTCRTLRDRFLPVYWRRVHAYFTVRNRPKRRIRTRAKMLERRMRGIQNTPYVLPFIHSLSITLEECNMGNWQPLAHFIRVLDLLPNLRELAILQIRPEMTSIFENTCKDKVYPSIVALTLVDDLSPLLHCFPNVQALTKCTHGLSAKLLGEAKHLYNHIHTFNHFSLSTNAEYCRPVVQCLRQTIPNLRCLSLRDHITLDTLVLLEGMDNLSELLVCHRVPRNASNYSPHLEDLVAAAERVLRTSKARGRKELRVQHLDETYGAVYDETVFIVGQPK